MKSARQRALQSAEEQMRRSGQWWEAFDRCVHRIRLWNVRYALRHCLYIRELEEYDRGNAPDQHRLEALKREMDEAHDMRLDEEKNMDTCAETARGAEMMARIYYEEHEERAWQKTPYPQR